MQCCLYVGYLDAPTSQPEDRSVLTKLFGLCLTGDSALHARLVDALIDLSAVEAECRGVGTSATLGPEQPALANVVAEAICGLKIQVSWSCLLCWKFLHICRGILLLLLLLARALQGWDPSPGCGPSVHLSSYLFIHPHTCSHCVA